MDHHRIPKQLVTTILAGNPQQYRWFQRIYQLEEDFKLHTSTLIGPNIKKRLADITRIADKTSNINSLIEDDKHIFIPPLSIIKKCIYSEYKKFCIYMWTNDAYRVAGRHQSCPVCSAPMQHRWREHILHRCQLPVLQSIRTWDSSVQWTHLLQDFSDANLQTIGRLTATWIDSCSQSSTQHDVGTGHMAVSPTCPRH